MPVTFYVGQPPEVFGNAVERLDGPHLLEGYLPIVQVNYRTNDGVVIAEEAFAPVTPEFAERGAVMVHFHPVANASRKKGGGDSSPPKASVPAGPKDNAD